MKRLISIIALFTVIGFLGGCITTGAQYKEYVGAYKVYAKSVPQSSSQKVCEVKTKRAVTLPAGFHLICYNNGGSQQVSVRPPQQPDYSGYYSLLGRVAGIAGNVYGLGLVTSGMESIFKSAVENAATTYGDYSGNGGNGYDGSINGSYNPVDSYNTDSHDQNWKDSHDQNWKDSHDQNWQDDHSIVNPAPEIPETP